MINLNGELVSPNLFHLNISNRGLNFGDALFETIRIKSGKPLFFESHYFRLMANMRICRMEIPQSFTPEFLMSEMTALIESHEKDCSNSRLKFLVYRDSSGLYTPDSNDIGYIISAQPIDSNSFKFESSFYKIDLFKDYFIPPGLLSTVKTNNRMVNILGGIYARENEFDNCLLLNTNKNIVEALNGNIFLVFDDTLKTPPSADGCINGIMRNQIIALAPKLGYKVEEVSISPFEIQRADEIFITNIILGVRPVTQYRKKIYQHIVSKVLVNGLNDII